jgi:hypothetical protein
VVIKLQSFVSPATFHITHLVDRLLVSACSQQFTDAVGMPVASCI